MAFFCRLYNVCFVLSICLAFDIPSCKVISSPSLGEGFGVGVRLFDYKYQLKTTDFRYCCYERMV